MLAATRGLGDIKRWRSGNHLVPEQLQIGNTRSPESRKRKEKIREKKNNLCELLRSTSREASEAPSCKPVGLPILFTIACEF